MTEFSRAFRDAVARRYNGGSIRGRVPESLRELARNHLSEVLDAGGLLSRAKPETTHNQASTLAGQRVREAKKVAAPTAKPLLPVQPAPPLEPTATTPALPVEIYSLAELAFLRQLVTDPEFYIQLGDRTLALIQGA